jgi:hypothetical protein
LRAARGLKLKRRRGRGRGRRGERHSRPSGKRGSGPKRQS